jgi:hypothetical protein
MYGLRSQLIHRVKGTQVDSYKEFCSKETREKSRNSVWTIQFRLRLFSQLRAIQDSEEIFDLNYKVFFAATAPLRVTKLAGTSHSAVSTSQELRVRVVGRYGFTYPSTLLLNEEGLFVAVSFFTALRLCGSAALRLCCSAAQRLRGSAALRLCGGSAALRLRGSAALRVCGSVAAWRSAPA